MKTSNYPREKQYRIVFLQALSLYVPAMGVASAIGFLVIYFITNAWQMLAIAAAALIGSALFLSSRILLRRDKLLLAAVLAIVVDALLLSAFALFFAGIDAILIVGAWVIPIFIAWFGIERNVKLTFSPVISVLTTVAILAIRSIQPISRLLVTDIAFLRLLIPLIVILGGSLLFLIVVQGLVANRLASRLVPSFLLIVLIPIATLSASSIFSGLQSDQRNAVNTLSDLLNQKNSEIGNLIESMKGDLKTLEQDTHIFLIQMIIANPDEDIEPFYIPASIRLNGSLTLSDRFQEFLLMDKDGNVLISTTKQHQGLNFAYDEFFWQGRRALFVNPPFYFQAVDEVCIIVSLPIQDQTGTTIGVLAGRSNLTGIQNILSVQKGIDPNIKLYLVNNNYSMLFSTDSGATETSIRTPATIQAISNAQNGFLLYPNHLKTSVIGVFNWLSDLKLVLLAEIPQAVAFSDIRTIVLTSLTFTVISAAIAVLGALLIIRTISDPLDVLANATRQVSGGNLNVRAKIEQEDEIGTVAHAFNDMTGQFQSLVANLEERVTERTRDLESRTLELQTAAQIARDASIARNVEDLLDHAARLIRERFGFYHVGIFLNDDKNEYSVLRAAGGEAGRLMLANKHKLKIGEVGIVGFVAQTGEPRIALDVGADAVHFRNPLLPYTRSEMALPLKVSERVIGVLDVQSDKVNAFDQNDITIMQILTDQLGVAVERTRLLQELEQNAEMMNKSFQEYTSRTWRTFIQQIRKAPGYRYEGSTIEPVDAPPAENLESLTQDTPTIIQGESKKPGSMLSVPIRLRGQALGTLNIRFQSDEISPEIVGFIEEAADRLALALENARLVQDAQRLASRERMINEFSAHVQQSTDLETVLQTTIRDLGNALGVPKTFIQIGLTPSNETPAIRKRKGAANQENK